MVRGTGTLRNGHDTHQRRLLINGEDDLLQLDRVYASTGVPPCIHPVLLGNSDPFSVCESCVCRPESRRVRGREERRVLDARENVEVGERRKNEDGDTSLDGREDGVGGQRAQYGTHFEVGASGRRCEDETRVRPNKWRE